MSHPESGRGWNFDYDQSKWIEWSKEEWSATSGGWKSPPALTATSAAWSAAEAKVKPEAAAAQDEWRESSDRSWHWLSREGQDVTPSDQDVDWWDNENWTVALRTDRQWHSDDTSWDSRQWRDNAQEWKDPEWRYPGEAWEYLPLAEARAAYDAPAAQAEPKEWRVTTYDEASEYHVCQYTTEDTPLQKQLTTQQSSQSYRQALQSIPPSGDGRTHRQHILRTTHVTEKTESELKAHADRMAQQRRRDKATTITPRPRDLDPSLPAYVRPEPDRAASSRDVAPGSHSQAASPHDRVLVRGPVGGKWDGLDRKATTPAGRAAAAAAGGEKYMSRAEQKRVAALNLEVPSAPPGKTGRNVSFAQATKTGKHHPPDPEQVEFEMVMKTFRDTDSSSVS